MDLRHANLPLAGRLDEVASVLRSRGALVLRAEPGAGKTSLVPPFLAMRPGKTGKVLCLEPRRVAAAQGAARVAELCGSRLGSFSGFRVRGEAKVSRETRVEFLTEGLLVRMLQADPGLEGVDAVILDEFHERSVHADLALALLLELRELRPELELVLMSATLDAERVAAFIGAPVLDVAGRVFPVETRWRPGRPDGYFDAAAFASAVAEALAATAGDVLCFLPGLGEISRAAGEIRTRGTDAELRILHGGLGLQEQRGVIIAPTDARRRVILSTSVAETSLTVPRVGAVVDVGLSRHSRFHLPSGMNRLVTERVSAAQADQRRGRAGRLGPGLCLRLWPEPEALRPSLDPEILRSELSGPALEAAIWGVDPEDLRWLDPPSPASWAAARELLRDLGALDADAKPTGLGRAAEGLGLEPRLAVLVAREVGSSGPAAALACACAALLGDRDPGTPENDPDFRLRLEALRSGRRDERLDRARAEALRIARAAGARSEGGSASRADLAEPGGLEGSAAPGSGAQTAIVDFDAEAEALAGVALAEAFPDRIAKREADRPGDRGDSALFAFPSGRRARLRGSLAREEWLVALEVDAGESEGKIRLAAPLPREAALAALGSRASIERSVEWNGWKARIQERRVVGRLTLSERRFSPEDARALIPALKERLEREGLQALPLSEEAASFIARVRYLARRCDEALLAAWRDEALIEDVEAWLGPYLRPGSGPALDETALLAALRERLSPALRSRLDREAPAFFLTPAGGRRRIEYPETGDASCELKIQELFGTAASPAVCGRPLVLKLLSPAGRPLQVSADLASFWRGAYPELRGPLKARYPKHYWPENPLEAEATKGPKPRR